MEGLLELMVGSLMKVRFFFCLLCCVLLEIDFRRCYVWLLVLVKLCGVCCVW